MCIRDRVNTAHANNPTEIRLALIRTVFNTSPDRITEATPHIIPTIMSPRTACKFDVTLTFLHVTQRRMLPLIVCSCFVHSCHSPILNVVRVCPLFGLPASFLSHPTTSRSPIQQDNKTTVIWRHNKNMNIFDASILFVWWITQKRIIWCDYVSVFA